MTDPLTTDTVFMWRFGTGWVCTNSLHIVRLIKRLTAGDNCVNVGLDGVLSLPSEFGNRSRLTVNSTAILLGKCFQKDVPVLFLWASKCYSKIIDSANKSLP